jgi:hypothetical protein
MFTVHCPRHGTAVLLGPDRIVRILNTDDGIELHWHCWCGECGVETYEHRHEVLR